MAYRQERAERRISAFLFSSRYSLLRCRVSGTARTASAQSGQGRNEKPSPARSPAHIVGKQRRCVEAWYPPPED